MLDFCPPLAGAAQLSKRPAVSVLIPVYNGERFLAEAIQSVLQQTLLPDEIIVVDDGSTDETAAIVAGLAVSASVPIRYVYQENQGPAAARNCGVRIARGDVIAFQDADDIWTEQKLEIQVGLLQRSSERSIVMGKVQYVQLSQTGELVPCAEPYDKPGFTIMLQSAIFRRSLFDTVGLFDESLRLGEDSDWYFRALERNVELSMHPDLVVLYRRHEGNVTNDRHAVRHHLFGALKRSLGRRRQERSSDEATASFSQITNARQGA